METCKVSVYYENPDSPVAVVDMPFHEDVFLMLDHIWCGMNHGSRQEFDALDGIRSMMVGDIVIIKMDNGHETGWQCEPSGWSQLVKG